LRNPIVKDETNELSRDGTAPPTQPWRNKLNLKPSYTTLGFAGMLSARDSAPTQRRVHADSGAERHRLHV